MNVDDHHKIWIRSICKQWEEKCKQNIQKFKPKREIYGKMQFFLAKHEKTQQILGFRIPLTHSIENWIDTDRKIYLTLLSVWSFFADFSIMVHVISNLILVLFIKNVSVRPNWNLESTKYSKPLLFLV